MINLQLTLAPVSEMPLMYSSNFFSSLLLHKNTAGVQLNQSTIGTVSQAPENPPLDRPCCNFGCSASFYSCDGLGR